MEIKNDNNSLTAKTESTAITDNKLNPADRSESEPNKENYQEELAQAKRKMKFWAISGISLMFLSIILTIFSYFLIKKNNVDISGIITAELENKASGNKSEINYENLTRRLIDGKYVEKGAENFYPLAFMIDNHADARPQSGLDKAQLVIEAEAEGGITRYLAVFAANEELPEIGPIRSARPYFVDWAKELSAVYVHVGGSPDALAKMIKENTLHINEFYDGEYFWRGDNFLAPHNVYTSAEKMAQFLSKKELSTGKFLAWKFKDDVEKENQGTTTLIAIDYILPEYKVVWRYDSENNSYVRELGGKKHLSAAGAEISAKNLIIQYVNSEAVDDELRQVFEHIGEGQAVLCLDGYCREGKWKKKSAEARTRFYNSDDNEFEFNAGNIWIQVVSPNYRVAY